MSNKYKALREAMGTLQEEAAAKGAKNERSQMILDLLNDFDNLGDELDRTKRYMKINGDSAEGKHLEGLRYRDERDALQLRLNKADQRNDDAISVMRTIYNHGGVSYYGSKKLEDFFLGLSKDSHPNHDPKIIGIERMPPMEYDEP